MEATFLLALFSCIAALALTAPLEPSRRLQGSLRAFSPQPEDSDDGYFRMHQEVAESVEANNFTASGFAELANACRLANQSGSGWMPVTRGQQSGERNLCLKGKAVPQLYVLGAPKCGTTSFAFEFAGAGGECAAETKEYHFWKEDKVQMYNSKPHRAINLWLRPLPDCDSTVRHIVADFTPEYLSTTKHPIHAAMLNSTLADDELSDAGLPVVFRNLYGPLAQHLLFVVMVREPLSRMHSWYYYSNAHKKESFMTWASDEIAHLKGGAWHSTYGWQLKIWTRIFEMRQFYIIPVNLFAGKASKQICKDVQDKLDFAMECHPAGHQRLQSSHPALEQDSDEAFLATSREQMADDKENLVDTLTVGSTKGMGLPGYTHSPGDKHQIKRWLERSW